MHSLGNVVSGFAPQPWLAALGAGLLLASIAALAIRGRQGRGGLRTLLAVGGATILLAALFSAEFIQGQVEQLSIVGAGWLLGIALAICGAIGVRLGRLLQAGVGPSSTLARSTVSAWVLLIAVNAITLWLAVDQSTAHESPQAAGGVGEFDARSSSAMQRVDGAYAVTDRGRAIPVFAAAIDAPSREAAWLDTHGGSFQMIVTHGLDNRSNGHGLVFTDGRYWFDGRRVAEVLADNGYLAVTQPALGDLVVYRDASGQIVHTAMVKFMDEQGLILIDSKLGSEERCLHQPAAAGLASFDRAYYRSDRAGHALPIISETDYPPSGSEKSASGAESAPAL